MGMILLDGQNMASWAGRLPGRCMSAALNRPAPTCGVSVSRSTWHGTRRDAADASPPGLCHSSMTSSRTSIVRACRGPSQDVTSFL